ncbi:MAG: MerR family transcriptional regulator, partial [Elusimicrobia bacterium]|nr:MerR family transcriptional regulator [Elusimicrobiota bacterium]
MSRAGSEPAAPPPLPDKEYFSIAEACRLLQVPPHVLRYWESRFTALRPTRLPGGHRRYSRGDIETAFRIRGLLRERRLTVEGARRVLAASRRPARLAAAPAGPGLNPAAAKLLRRV